MHATVSASAQVEGRALPLGRLLTHTQVWLTLITLVGLGLRLAWVSSQDTAVIGGDPLWYHTVATNVAEGRGYVIDWSPQHLEQAGPGEPTAFWPPGYPLALGAAYKAFGADAETAKLFNAVLSALAIPLVFLLGRIIIDGRAGLIAAAVYALLPESIVASTLVISEFLFIVFFLGALIALARPPGGAFLWTALGFGALAGLAVLTRGQGLVLLPVAFVWLLARDGLLRGARWLVVAGLAFVAVLTPWTVRNALVMDSFVPVATSAGINLRIGHSPDSAGNMIWPEAIDQSAGEDAFYYAMQPDHEARSNRIYAERAWEYAREHPSEELSLAGKKLGWLYRSDPNEWVTQIETLGATPIKPDWLDDRIDPILVVSHYVLLGAAALGLLAGLVRRMPGVWLLATVVLCWSAFHIVFFAQSRFHLPLLPLFAIGAALAIASAARPRGRVRR